MKKHYSYTELKVIEKVSNGELLKDKDFDIAVGLQLANKMPKKAIKNFLKKA